MPRRNSVTSPEADDRFNMDVPADTADKIMDALLAIDELSKTRPMAAVRASVKLQANARTIERNAALFGNSHYKISWEKIGSLFGHTAQWAYKRYVELPRQAALSGAIRLAKPSKPEVKKEPDGQ